MNRLLLILFLIFCFNSFSFSQDEGIKLICHLEWPSVEMYDKVESIEIYRDFCSIECLSEVNKLKNLKSITIKQFVDSELPIFFDFKNLEELNIINSPNLNIQKIFNHLTCYSTLKIIRILNCDIQEIPAEIYENFSNLEELSLRNNRLKSIEKDFASANTLNLLDLTNNDLETISINWLLYVSLDELFLSNNWELINSSEKINKFCSNISGLNIEVLFLNNLGIKDFPCCLNGLQFLKNLHLDYNLIRSLPECEGFENLEILNLTGNKVFDVPKKFKEKVSFYE